VHKCVTHFYLRYKYWQTIVLSTLSNATTKA
jgi:hypothetical protein